MVRKRDDAVRRRESDEMLNTANNNKSERKHNTTMLSNGEIEKVGKFENTPPWEAQLHIIIERHRY